MLERWPTIDVLSPLRDISILAAMAGAVARTAIELASANGGRAARRRGSARAWRRIRRDMSIVLGGA